MEPVSGSLLGGRYRLGALIGRGGMGSVFEAIQEDLRRRVAVKVLDSRLAGDPSQVERFRREALAAAALGHANIVTVTDFQWPQGEAPFLVMEYLTGQSLGELLTREPRLALSRVAFIASQMLDALAAAHAAGIVHRDIKPDNVFLTTVSQVADVVKLLDFGVAKLGDPDAAKLTESGAMVGTPAYMSPEQTRGATIDARADIYGVGAVMYHALTGEMPFRGPSVPAVIVAIATTPPQPISELRPDVPLPFAALVDRAMSKDPSMRFGSAAEMRAALTPWVEAGRFGVSSTPSPLAAHAVSSTAATIAGTPAPDTPVVVRSNPPATASMPVQPPPTYPSSGPPQSSSQPYPPPPAVPSAQPPTPPPVAVPPAPRRSGCMTVFIALLVTFVALVAIGAFAMVELVRSKPAQDLSQALANADGGLTVVVVDPDAGAVAINLGDKGLTAQPTSGVHVSGVTTPTHSPASGALDASALAQPFPPPVVPAAPPIDGDAGKRYSGSTGFVGSTNFGDCDRCDWEKSKSALEADANAIGACFAASQFVPPVHEYPLYEVTLGPGGSIGSVKQLGTAPMPSLDACFAALIRRDAGPHVKGGSGKFTVSFTGRCPTFECK